MGTRQMDHLQGSEAQEVLRADRWDPGKMEMELPWGSAAQEVSQADM